MTPHDTLLWEPVIRIRPRTARSSPVNDKNNLEEPNELGDLSAENTGNEDEGAQTASSPAASHWLRDLLTMTLLPAANEGISHALYTSLFDLPQVPEGGTQVFFEQGGWSVFLAPGSSTNTFIITVEGRPHGQEVAKVHHITLPSTLAATQTMDFHAWNLYMKDIRCVFQELLSDYQMDSIVDMAYIYIWFSQNRPDAQAANFDGIVLLWNELQELQTSTAAMGVYLAMCSEDLLMNFSFWARSKILIGFGGVQGPACC
ncbi:uncharacterized protein TRAVEDRAFT_23398 [Trametes versicolor FP-101664 SS1]|uniref:uncharacterized protein n=1 Tax=Trametes versicolor (strain FP-101664) TaxID=717944 RepID=UPI0004624703|nr:uncharacterized protein TRAVEDRAFT_23398 [Trametes versicolor FP-101664 SS1]EIW54261.1 hypothetical protein TRAVEDRAFT_23398 [Trametes versicolor FP-101664 SS1]